MGAEEISKSADFHFLGENGMMFYTLQGAVLHPENFHFLNRTDFRVRIYTPFDRNREEFGGFRFSGAALTHAARKGLFVQTG